LARNKPLKDQSKYLTDPALLRRMLLLKLGKGEKLFPNDIIVEEGNITLDDDEIRINRIKLLRQDINTYHDKY
jgi:hypothetical protein